MSKLFFKSTLIIVIATTFLQPNRLFAALRGKVVYDFSFAEMAIEYLETNDSTILKKIAELDATNHIFNHACRYNNLLTQEGRLNFVKNLLLKYSNKNDILTNLKDNLKYTKTLIVKEDIPKEQCLKYLPKTYQYNTVIFFTVGYDIGVVYGQNASLNIANSKFIGKQTEIKYYLIHELHHAGFVSLKDNKMPSLEISSFSQMANLIEYFTHLEGMGTYTPYDTRDQDSQLDADQDYIDINNTSLMNEYEKEFLDIYFYFKNNPDKILCDEDWNKISILSDKKRLWYKVGAKMAKEIDTRLGREKLINLIANPSEQFIKTYLSLF